MADMEQRYCNGNGESNYKVPIFTIKYEFSWKLLRGKYENS